MDLIYLINFLNRKKDLIVKKAVTANTDKTIMHLVGGNVTSLTQLAFWAGVL